MGQCTRLLHVLLLLLTGARGSHSARSRSGCRAGSSPWQRSMMQACTGTWFGHVSRIRPCARGWRVCDVSNLVTRTTDLSDLPGCYATAAVENNGKCYHCDDVTPTSRKSVGLVVVGSDCPSNVTSSCVPGGTVLQPDPRQRTCVLQRDVTDGVLCCKIPGVPPQILVRPEPLTHVTSGVTFVLSCQALGTPTPSVTWYKDGRELARNISRIAVFSSGYLLIAHAKVKDAGRYLCVVENAAGRDSAAAKVIVTDHPSGCADGVTDALAQYEEIQACSGVWEGHVKRGRVLCARGWHVCTPRDTHLLSMITWTDVMSTKGCYAYNAANTMTKCSRCWRREQMAGLGRGCARIRRSHRSCLAQGRVDVFRGPRGAGCHYRRGYTQGVVCCKRQPRRRPPSARCRPRCMHGGTCVDSRHCACAPGYKGAWCQNPICPGGCIPNSTCARPGVCVCKMGHVGRKCKAKVNSKVKPNAPGSRCRRVCLHGGKCKRGKCVCLHHRHGNQCQYVNNQSHRKQKNRTE